MDRLFSPHVAWCARTKSAALRTASLCQDFATLTTQGRVQKSAAGYHLATVSRTSFLPRLYRPQETGSAPALGIGAPDPTDAPRLRGGRAPLASDPSTMEDSRKTTGRPSSAGLLLIASSAVLVLAGASAITARHELPDRWTLVPGRAAHRFL
jgi:hypothetical protein